MAMHHHHHHLPQQQQQPDRGLITTTCTSPSAKDIVCGRGRRLDQHAGNKVFRRYIKHAAAEYTHENTSKSCKGSIINSIKQHIQNEGMRFIKKDKNYDWRELTISEIKLKIGHALRDCRQQYICHAAGSKVKQCINQGQQQKPPAGELLEKGAYAFTTTAESEAPFRTDIQKNYAVISSKDIENIGSQDKNGVCQEAIDDFTKIQQSLLCDYPNNFLLKQPQEDSRALATNVTALSSTKNFTHESEKGDHSKHDSLVDLLVDMDGVDEILSQLDDPGKCSEVDIARIK